MTNHPGRRTGLLESAFAAESTYGACHARTRRSHDAARLSALIATSAAPPPLRRRLHAYRFKNAGPRGNVATGRSHAIANAIDRRSPGFSENFADTAAAAPGEATFAADADAADAASSSAAASSSSSSSSANPPFLSNASHAAATASPSSVSYSRNTLTSTPSPPSAAIATPPWWSALGVNVPSVTPTVCACAPPTMIRRLRRPSRRLSREEKNVSCVVGSDATLHASLGPLTSNGATSADARTLSKLSMIETFAVARPSFRATKRSTPVGTADAR